MVWITRQGAMSAGGFMQGIGQANDGTLVAMYDGGNCYIGNDEKTHWDNLFHQDRLPTGNSQAVWGQGQSGSVVAKGINAATIAIAPSDSNYIYVIARSYANAKAYESAQLWRSTDKGLSWVNTGKYVPLSVTGLGLGGTRGMGRTMAIDPVNPSHVLISGDAGDIWRTTDGGDTLVCLNAPGGPLEGILPSVVTTAATATGGRSITVGYGTIPSAISSPPSGFSLCRYISDVSNNAAQQTGARISATTATTISVDAVLAGTGIAKGDTMVLGFRAGIAFDRSSAVLDGITQGVYIGWAYGADAIYGTTDGCATFAAVGTGGPSHSLFLDCSDDGVLYVCPYADGTNLTANYPFRYRSGTWTELKAITSSTNGNTWNSVAADPLNRGHVAFVRASGGIRFSTNYGTSLAYRASGNGLDANYNGTGYPRTDTQVPWLEFYKIHDGINEPKGTQQNSMAHGQSLFDRVVSGRLWISEGTSIWYCHPPKSGTNVVLPLTGFNKNQQSIILNEMIKAPGGTLIATSQDRCGFRFLDPEIEPTGDLGMRSTGASALIHGWGIDYAKNNPNFLVMARTGGIDVSTTEGRNWRNVTTAVGRMTAVACQTTENFVVFSNAANALWTKNGGISFHECIFNGSPIKTGWNGNFSNRHCVCADLFDLDTYYAYNWESGLWRSTNGGETFELMCTVIPHPTIRGAFMNSISSDFTLRAVPGRQGHLFIATGTAQNRQFPLMFSKNAGASWRVVSGTGITWAVAVGKEYSGAKYPALYTAGRVTTDPAPTDFGIFHCFDFDPDTLAARWERLSRAPAGNMDRPRHMCADLDRYGHWYMANGSTGYVYGQIQSTSVR